MLNRTLEFIIAETGNPDVFPKTDIERDLQCNGDDFHELIELYSKKFEVNISSYKWYFHSTEEGGIGIGSFFFKPPWQKVKRIPVTPEILVEFATSKIWAINYPEHKIPKIRLDILLNLIVGIITISWLVYYFFAKVE